MDNSAGIEVVDYNVTKNKLKNEFVKDITNEIPRFTPYQKELESIYEASINNFEIYWLLNDNKKLRIDDFVKVVWLLEHNKLFNRFFIEIYSNLVKMNKRKEKQRQFHEKISKIKPIQKYSS